MLEALKEEVLRANLALRDWELVTLTWGNASGIDRESGLVVIKPSGVAYDDMKAEDMVVLDLNGNVVEGELNPSSDAPTHLELYRSFAEIGGVVHTHSVCATAFAQAHMPIFALGTTHADHFYGDIPCTPDLTDEEIADEYELNTGKVIVREFEGRDPMAMPAVLVASHGVFTWGKNAMKAAENALVAEKTAQMAQMSLTIGPMCHIKQSLLDKHYYRKHGANAYYGQNTAKKKVEIDFDALLADKECSCGKKHVCDMKKIVMKKGALSALPEVISYLGDYRKVVMICDENTYAAAGKRASELYPFAQVIVLDPTDLHANKHGVAMAEKKLIKDADLLVAVGSGTVHDITRYTAYSHGLKFVSVPTAASVDGFVSNVAAMTWNGAKKTIPAGMPIAMVADIDVISKAPMRLTASGVGDMIGKYTALVDWRIGNALKGEFICDEIMGLVYEALEKVKTSAPRLNSGDEEAFSSLMYGLVLSGVAMQFVGSSRPASGAEHHISHFIEMTVPMDVCSALHGEKVGVGERVVIDYYHKLAQMSDAEFASLLANKPIVDEKYIAEKFGILTPEIVKENENSCSADITNEYLLEKLSAIREIIREHLPTLDVIDPIYDAVGACKTFSDIGLDESMREKTIVCAPLVRNRFTLMRLLAI